MCHILPTRDTDGMGRFQNIVRSYYKGTDVSESSTLSLHKAIAIDNKKVIAVYIFLQGFMLVFDTTNEKSFDNIKQWLETIDMVCN